MNIEDREQLNTALQELSQLTSKASELDAECEQKLQEIKSKYASKKVLDDEQTTFEVREKELLNAIELYCESNRDELLPAGEKSLRLTHGTIGWRKGKDTIKPIKKESEKTMLDRVVEKFAAALKALLNRTVISKKIKTADAISVSCSWNKAGLLKSLSENTINPNDLKPFGFKVVQGEDVFYCDVEQPKIEGQKQP